MLSTEATNPLESITISAPLPAIAITSLWFRTTKGETTKISPPRPVPPENDVILLSVR
jgi:hypothetical protein